LRLRLAHTVLRVDLHDVHVRADVEINIERQFAVVAVVGLQVEQFVHAVHFGFNRRGDGFHHGLRGRAAIRGGDLDERRAHRRILRDRQALQADETDDDG